MINKGEEQRAHLIMKLRGQGIRSANVLSAIESVPRDIFIENALKNHAWEMSHFQLEKDKPLVSHIS